MRTTVGLLFFMIADNPTARTYNSPPTTLDAQLRRLEDRGLSIVNHNMAKAFLEQIGYYRFSGYALHYEVFKDRRRTHIFKKGSTFEQVISLYSFDSDLRKLLFSAIEYIEIAFRSQLCLQMSLYTKDSHWPINNSLFNEQFNHEKFIEDCEKEVSRSPEVFIKSYCSNYTNPELPASWMLMEIISLGVWSRVYKSLKYSDARLKIAQYFNLKPESLRTWIHAVTVIRNLCAHHARLWNRSLTIKPRLTKTMKSYYPRNSSASHRLVLVLDIISELLKPIGRYEWFIEQLNVLFEQYPDVPYTHMGLKTNKFSTKYGVRLK